MTAKKPLIRYPSGPGFQEAQLASSDLSDGPSQPLDATLTALAGLDTVTGLVYQTGADTFTKVAGSYSAGVVVLPGITDNGNGTVTLNNNGVVNLYSSSGSVTPLKSYPLTGGTFSLTDLTTNFIYVDYNSGAPIYASTANRDLINSHYLMDRTVVYTIERNGLALNITDWDQTGIGLTEKALNRRFDVDARYQRSRSVGGLAISDTGSNTFALSAGRVWDPIKYYDLGAVASGSDTVWLAYQDASLVWHTSAVTTYNNTQYNDATGLVILSTNKYAVNHIWRLVSATTKTVWIVLGRGDYKLLDAQSAPTPPAPPFVSPLAIYCGRIIVQKNASTATQIDSAFTQNLGSAPVLVHNDLTGRDAVDCHPVASITGAAPDMSAITKEVTGFADPGAVVLNYDPTARTIQLTGTATAYWRNTLVSSLTSGWVSSAHTNTTGHVYWLYYDGANFLWATDSFPGFDKLLIAIVNFGASDKYAMRECHGVMQWQVHEEFHDTVGTYRESGGAVGGYTLASTTATERRPSVTQTVIQDEDNTTTLPALADNGPYTQIYLASTGTSTYAVDAAEIVPVSGSNPYYNSFSSPNWAQTLMPANSVGTVWLMGIPATASATSQKYRFLWIQPQWITQAQSTSPANLATARATELLRSPSELNLGTFASEVPEHVIFARLTIQYTGGNWTIEAVNVVNGTRYSQFGSPSGNFLSSVAVASPLTGSGVLTDPLTIAAATASVPGYMTSAQAGVISQIITTAGQTYTLPATSATLARTDAGQTFTGTEVFNGVVQILGGDTKGVTFRGNILNSEEYNGATFIAVNYHGYNNGVTQFRDFRVYDGKANQLLFVDAANARVELTATTGRALQVDSTTAATTPTNGAVYVVGGIGTSDYFCGKYRSSDGTAGATVTLTGAPSAMTIKDGIITSASPGSGGALNTRAEAAHTTALLAANATETFTLTLNKLSGIIKIATDYPAWIRIYGTDAARTSDNSRLINTDPAANIALYMDAATNSALSLTIVPVKLFANMDSPTANTAYVSVQNLDAVSRAITLTVTYLGLEA